MRSCSVIEPVRWASNREVWRNSSPFPLNGAADRTPSRPAKGRCGRWKPTGHGRCPAVEHECDLVVGHFLHDVASMDLARLARRAASSAARLPGRCAPPRCPRWNSKAPRHASAARASPCEPCLRRPKALGRKRFCDQHAKYFQIPKRFPRRPPGSRQRGRRSPSSVAVCSRQRAEAAHHPRQKECVDARGRAREDNRSHAVEGLRPSATNRPPGASIRRR